MSSLNNTTQDDVRIQIEDRHEVGCKETMWFEYDSLWNVTLLSEMNLDFEWFAKLQSVYIPTFQVGNIFPSSKEQINEWTSLIRTYLRRIETFNAEGVPIHYSYFVEDEQCYLIIRQVEATVFAFFSRKERNRCEHYSTTATYEPFRVSITCGGYTIKLGDGDRYAVPGETAGRVLLFLERLNFLVAKKYPAHRVLLTISHKSHPKFLIENIDQEFYDYLKKNHFQMEKLEYVLDTRQRFELLDYAIQFWNGPHKNRSFLQRVDYSF